jgi:hypothetical protein
MERGVEYADHRYAGHKSLACFDTEKVRRIVKRSKRNALFQSFDDFVGDEHGTGKLFACVHYSVAYRADLGHFLNNAVFRILQSLHYLGDGFGVVFHRNFGDYLVFAGLAVGDDGTVHADPLYESLAQQIFTGHVKDLVLEGRASAVDN